jgi:hypothetical protein
MCELGQQLVIGYSPSSQAQAASAAVRALLLTVMQNAVQCSAVKDWLFEFSESYAPEREWTVGF